MSSKLAKSVIASGVFLLVVGCAPTPERARAKIEARELTFDQKGIGNAVLSSDQKLIRLFIKAGYDINAFDDPTKAPLMLATRLPNPHTMDLLIDAGARAEELPGVLNLPATRGDLKTMAKLLEAGAVVDSKDNSGRTAMLAAVQAGRTESVRFLLEHGASPNGRPGAGRRSQNPLIEAVRNNQAEIVDVLIAGGANVNVVGGMTTPLMQAAGNGRTKIVDKLLAAGADPGFEYLGFTAAWAASQAGHHELAARLEQALDGQAAR
jgi:ankyrin repeat protein